MTNIAGLSLTGKNYQKMFPYEHTWKYMEGVWEGLDLRICNHDSGFELDAWDAPNESQSAEGEGERVDVGSVLGEAPIQESPDNIYPLREGNGSS